MWSPTHIQVLVKRAKGLKIKGKDGTNDAFVTIGVGKEKYQTSVKEKSSEDVDWCEQCELAIPQQGNTAEVVLTALHRNFLGVDEFLGMVSLPLRDFDVYEKPKTKWYVLQCKPGQKKKDYRGELEVRTSFTVKVVPENSNGEGSTQDLSNKKNKGSLQSLNKAAANLGGSLMSLGHKEKKNLKKLAKSVTHKVEKAGEKAMKNLSRINLPSITTEHTEGSNNDQPTPTSKQHDKHHINTSFLSPSTFRKSSALRKSSISRNRDPGVNSDDEDFDGHADDEDDMFRFDALSHRSSGSSINAGNNLGIVSKTSTPMSGSLENLSGGDLLRKAFQGTPRSGRRMTVATPSPLLSSSKKMSTNRNPEPLDEWEQKLLGKRAIAPYVSPLEKRPDTISQLSLHSGGSQNNSRTNTLERPMPKNLTDSLPRNATIQEETPTARKKIIPVRTDLESSPSPEIPSSPATSTHFQDSLNSLTLSPQPNAEADQEEANRKKKSFGLKFRSFREKDDLPKVTKRESDESLNSGNHFSHSRNHSTGSGESGTSPTPGNPPSGPRVVLGRETTPTPQQPGPSRIPKEVWDRFDGKSREDLIETIIKLQNRIEAQARKQTDLEDYIDSLLMKVLSAAPCLLQKDPHGASNDSFNVKMAANMKNDSTHCTIV